MRQPFSVNALAQAAGAEAILHQDDVSRRVESTIAERLRVEEGLRELGLATAETHANFSWIDLGDAEEAEIVAGLAERQIAVRPGTPLGDPGHIRVSYGTAEENGRFLAAPRQQIARLTRRLTCYKVREGEAIQPTRRASPAPPAPRSPRALLLFLAI